jgi:UDPglucose 6-dehydrogenase/GDP-mannose 6-dehydrogenase
MKKAAKSIGVALNKKSAKHVVVVKSTVLPGTTENVVKTITQKSIKNQKIKVGFAMNPEFLREGNAIDDVLNPDRIVIGTSDKLSKTKLKKLYKSWNCDKIFVNTKTAEMIKYTNNILLASQISIVNELANLTSRIGNIDFKDVLLGIYTDKRWNPLNKKNIRIETPILQYLSPGPGFGGSCFPKDINALLALSRKLNVKMPILNSVRETNKKQPLEVLRIISKYYPSLKGINISLLGLSFKPDTDDVRDTPSLLIIKELLKRGAIIKANDPMAISNFSKLISNRRLIYCEDWETTVANTNIIIVVTRWEKYAKINPKLLFKISNAKLLIDTRRIYNKKIFEKYFIYTSIGLNV